MAIHHTAIVDPQAEVDSTVEIGPHAVIEGPTKIGAHTRIYANAYLSGWTTIGRDCQIHPGAVIGHLPQDFHFEPCRSFCTIGDGTIVREFASIHRGTQPESSTVIGRGCFIMGYSHIGHNCVFGDGVKFYNMAAASGHVEVGDNAIISGYTVIHQFVRIGSYCMIGGLSRIGMDVSHYFTAIRESECVGINAIGMRRAGFSSDQIADAKQCYRVLYRSGTTFRKAVDQLAETVTTDVGRQILEFLRSDSKRGFVGGPKHRENTTGRIPELPDDPPDPT